MSMAILPAASQTVSPLGWGARRVWDMATAVPQGVLGGLKGGWSGYTSATAAAAPTGETVTAFDAALKVAKDGFTLEPLKFSRELFDKGEMSIGKWIRHNVAYYTGKLFNSGTYAISHSGIGDALSSLLKTNVKYGEVFESIGNALTKCRPAGGVGLAVLGIGAVAGTIMGTKLALSSWHEVSQIKKDLSTDNVQNSTIHGAQALSAAAIGLGCVSIPFATALAPVLIVPGLIGVASCFALRKAIGGYHMLRYPDKAPWPLNYFLRAAQNNSRFYSG